MWKEHPELAKLKTHRKSIPVFHPELAKVSIRRKIRICFPPDTHHPLRRAAISPSGTAAGSRKGEWYGWKPSSSSNCSIRAFELVLLSKLDKQLPVERFEAAVSQSTVPSPPLRLYSLRDGSLTLLGSDEVSSMEQEPPDPNPRN